MCSVALAECLEVQGFALGLLSVLRSWFSFGKVLSFIFTNKCRAWLVFVVKDLCVYSKDRHDEIYRTGENKYEHNRVDTCAAGS